MVEYKKGWVLLRVEDTEFTKQLVYCIFHFLVRYCFPLFIVLSFCFVFVFLFFVLQISMSSTQSKSHIISLVMNLGRHF